MGIKPTYIKALGEDLISKYGAKFSSEFEANKMTVTLVTVMESKPVRNRVAGYITRKMNAKQRRPK